MSDTTRLIALKADRDALVAKLKTAVNEQDWDVIPSLTDQVQSAEEHILEEVTWLCAEADQKLLDNAY